MNKASLRISIAIFVVLGTILYLAFSAAQANKSYYVTITELQGMGNKAYTRHLRVAGNVAPGSIARAGTHAHFTLVEQGKLLPVEYQGAEPPPDTFKDDCPGARHRHLRPRRRLPRHGTAGQVRLEIRAGQTEPAAPAPAMKPAPNATASLR